MRVSNRYREVMHIFWGKCNMPYSRYVSKRYVGNVGHPSTLQPFSPARPLTKTPTLALFNTHYPQQQAFRKSTSEGNENSMENGAPQNEGRDPSGFLSQIIGNAVTVKLNSGVVYKGESEARRLVLVQLLTTQDRRAPVCRWVHEHRARED